MARALDGRLAETLALFRMRALRFAQDEATCALAEQLDERLACGVAPRPQTARAAERFLDELRAGPTARLDAHRLARTEGIDLDAELAARHAHARRPLRAADPRLVVLVVGAPRSGTSHLLNLLAFQQRFAYLTNVSCWAWPTYHLARTRKRPFATLGPGIFSADSKRLKLDARLVLPTEGEDVLARAIPCYERLRGHEYRLLPAHVRDPALLMGSLRAHLEHFERSAIVVKSPFNAFRIGELRALLGDAVRIVHIHRDGYAAAASIAANGFAYRWRDGSALRAEQAWAAHVGAALDAERDGPVLRVAFERLVRDPRAVLRELLAWLGLDGEPRLPGGAPPARQPPSRGGGDAAVEALHRRLERRGPARFPE